MIFDEVFFNELAILSDFLKAWSTSLMFAAGRIFGFFIIFPMFLSLKVGRSLLFGVSIALGLPLAGPLYAEYGEMIEAAGRFELVYLVHEAIVGLVVGLVFAVPFWMVAMAGVMIDVQRGATQSTGTDDALHDQKTATSDLFSHIFMVYFLTNGGLVVAYDVITATYDYVPFGTGLGTFDEGWSLRIAETVTFSLLGAFTFILPFTIIFAIVNVAFIYVSKAAPTLQTPDLVFLLKNLTFVGVLYLFVVGMETGFSRELVEYLAQVGEWGLGIGFGRSPEAL